MRARGGGRPRPNFSLTFIHPDTVRAGELYDLVLQIQNTSECAGEPRDGEPGPSQHDRGADARPPARRTQVIDTIPPGDVGTATFRLEAMRTGRVTASTLELSGEGGLVSGRKVSLRAGVGELGEPLSPDTLILPPALNTLRDRGGERRPDVPGAWRSSDRHTRSRSAPPGSLRPGRLADVPRRSQFSGARARRGGAAAGAEPPARGRRTGRNHGPKGCS